jgi:hypothetical protein
MACVAVGTYWRVTCPFFPVLAVRVIADYTKIATHMHLSLASLMCARLASIRFIEFCYST